MTTICPKCHTWPAHPWRRCAYDCPCPASPHYRWPTRLRFGILGWWGRLTGWVRRPPTVQEAKLVVLALLVILAASLHLNYVLVTRVEAVAAERDAAKPLPGPTREQSRAICAHWRATGQGYRCAEV